MEYRNTDMLNAINEYIRNPRYRELLRLRFCEGATYEQIAEAVNYSPQHVKRERVIFQMGSFLGSNSMFHETWKPLIYLHSFVSCAQLPKN